MSKANHGKLPLRRRADLIWTTVPDGNSTTTIRRVYYTGLTVAQLIWECGDVLPPDAAIRTRSMTFPSRQAKLELETGSRRLRRRYRGHLGRLTDVR